MFSVTAKAVGNVTEIATATFDPSSIAVNVLEGPANHKQKKLTGYQMQRKELLGNTSLFSSKVRLSFFDCGLMGVLKFNK